MAYSQTDFHVKLNITYNMLEESRIYQDRSLERKKNSETAPPYKRSGA
jgi:hypothetical protein